MATRDEVVAWLEQLTAQARRLAKETNYLPEKVHWQWYAIMAEKATRMLRQPGDSLAAYGLVGDG